MFHQAENNYAQYADAAPNASVLLRRITITARSINTYASHQAGLLGLPLTITRNPNTAPPHSRTNKPPSQQILSVL